VRSRLSRARATLRQLMSDSSPMETVTEPRPASAVDSRWRFHLPRS
jgi:hypothetical protein